MAEFLTSRSRDMSTITNIYASEHLETTSVEDAVMKACPSQGSSSYKLFPVNHRAIHPKIPPSKFLA